MIKVATEEDIETIMKLAKNFMEHANYYQQVDLDKSRELALNFIKGDKKERIILLYDDIAMLVGMATPFVFGKALVASELVWWVEPQARNKEIGRALLEAFEYWAKEKAGCGFMTMSCLDNSVAKFYESNGYKLYEYAYFKELN